MNEQTKKKVGRPAGSKNKISPTLRDILVAFMLGSLEEATELWRSIPDPYQKFKVWVDLLAFVLPKPTPVPLESENSKKEKTFAEELAEIEANGGRII